MRFPSPPRIDVRFEGRTQSAVALALRGQEACLVLDDVPPREADVYLVLDWQCGATTRLDGRLRDVALDGRTARIDIHGVTGDWAPFVAYLGGRFVKR
ncbi:MAG: hypothetical protein ACC662_07160 [Planctomycetota bacterium]